MHHLVLTRTARRRCQPVYDMSIPTSNLGTKEAANLISRKYGELFPTIYISHKINGVNQVSLSYNRRITRPTFNDLAPFTIFFDPKTFYSGNPTLQPAIANTLQGWL